LTAPLLGVGSLLLTGRRWALPVGLVYTGLAVGIAVSVPLESAIAGTSVPDAQDALSFLPTRLVAVLGNSLGTLAVVAVAVASLRRRPLGNALILVGVGLAAAGTAAGGLGVGGGAVFIALAACALYGGFVARPGAVRKGRARTAAS
ncbi:MAG: hypothetical protein M3540_02175, partial [Actinomycetota bacterium]|nr:hypothetical protein [Actinomycetota bacterium]